jgi:deoxycytidylate deaminase
MPHKLTDEIQENNRRAASAVVTKGIVESFRTLYRWSDTVIAESNAIIEESRRKAGHKKSS